MSEIETTDEVISALGGSTKLARFIGATPQTVNNWRIAARGRFPAKTFPQISAALAEKGLRASPELWGGIAQYPIEDLPQVVSPAGA